MAQQAPTSEEVKKFEQAYAELAYYAGKFYICTNAATPTWELITSA